MCTINVDINPGYDLQLNNLHRLIFPNTENFVQFICVTGVMVIFFTDIFIVNLTKIMLTVLQLWFLVNLFNVHLLSLLVYELSQKWNFSTFTYQPIIRILEILLNK